MKKNYVEPMTKTLSMMVEGSVCEPAVTSAAQTPPPTDEPLF